MASSPANHWLWTSAESYATAPATGASSRKCIFQLVPSTVHSIWLQRPSSSQYSS